MPRRPFSERAAFVSTVLGVAMGLLFLFAPMSQSCSVTTTISSPGSAATPGPIVCSRVALWQVQPIFPMPFFAVLVWSIAPAVTYFGVRSRGRGRRGVGNVLVVLGVLLEGSVMVSFGAAPFFVPFVLLPLLVTTAIAVTRS